MAEGVPKAAVRLAGSLGESARAVLSGRQPPAVPRDAATVMLLRSSAVGLEVYMLRRKASMAFAPGAFVFPGGSVDTRDADEEVAWAGPDAADWADVLAAPPSLARALVCAAVRETFEESGVLLAGESADSVVADTTSEDWEADRRALLDRSVSLAGLLTRRGLVLRADLLRPWSRWITPVVEPRRYDTRFFAAALPPGQRTRDVGGEAAEVSWIRPADAIAAGHRGEIRLFPPTAVSLSELADCGDLGTVLAGPRQVAPIVPEVHEREGAVWLTVPGVAELPAMPGGTAGSA
ncbi:MAG: NUDIX hydrolase [Actinobacteria bacterium]|nr:NUDIX hydrolase [Actinomycetota bacterium]